MEEVTQKVKRSELYNEIYAIVKQIPRANVDSDCMDASSASGAIEKLIASRDSRILSAVPSVCAWKQEDQFDTRCYATSCDAMIAMTEGTPEENDYKFCPFCGKPIQVERGIAG